MHNVLNAVQGKNLLHNSNLSISENFNRMPVSIAQWQCRRWIWNHHFSVTKIDSKTWIAICKFYGHEILHWWWVRDRSSIEHQLTAGRCRRHKLKTQFVHLTWLQWLQDHIPIITGECHLRLLAARAFKTNWARTAEKRHISVTHTWIILANAAAATTSWSWLTSLVFQRNSRLGRDSQGWIHGICEARFISTFFKVNL